AAQQEDVMRQRRRARRRTPPLFELVGPRLGCRREAVAALRLSAKDEGLESIVVLICDRERRIVLATEFEDAPASGVATLVDLVLRAVPPGSRLVIGLFRGERGAGEVQLDRLELEAVDDALRSCRRCDVELVDVLVLCGSEAVESVAGSGYEVDNGHR
ncbi:MAG: hypothetical protein M3203_04575, partial [Actinomycetota bacterium]|nr:hypothetical protein [Actinomycetota bacterium]